MLRDSAGFAFGNAGGTNGVEQSRFAVIDVSHDGDHGRTRAGFNGTFFAARGGVGDFLRGLFFERDDVGFGSEEARHFGREFGIERLVDGREHAAAKQAGDEIFRADAELLGKILHADAFGDGDAARDGLRLVGDHHARRRSVALHRAFFDSARNVALSGTTRWTAGTRAGARRAGRRHRSGAGSDTEWTRTGRRLTSGMHGATLAGTQRRTRGAAGRLRARALENRLTGDGPSGRGTCWRSWCGLTGGCGRLDRRLVHGTRAGLRHDHARRRRSGQASLVAAEELLQLAVAHGLRPEAALAVRRRRAMGWRNCGLRRSARRGCRRSRGAGGGAITAEACLGWER